MPTAVTHRIIAIEAGPDGRPAFRTKGDFNEAADPWNPVTLNEPQQARYVFQIPVLGYVLAALEHPHGAHRARSACRPCSSPCRCSGRCGARPARRSRDGSRTTACRTTRGAGREPPACIRWLVSCWAWWPSPASRAARSRRARRSRRAARATSPRAADTSTSWLHLYSQATDPDGLTGYAHAARADRHRPAVRRRARIAR